MLCLLLSIHSCVSRGLVRLIIDAISNGRDEFITAVRVRRSHKVTALGRLAGQNRRLMSFMLRRPMDVKIAVDTLQIETCIEKEL